MAAPGNNRAPGQYFEKKGEVHELRQLLQAAATDKNQQKKRDAIKKVIAYMTLGIDVSPLFSEMVMASATQDRVQKKMVYQYIVNYAESNAEIAILAVNTLQKDCRDDDPMIRGLALRSLCSLSLQNMVEYLQPAVQKALQDVNGYVRKTAVIGAVKLFHIAPSAVLETEIITDLKKLISDSDVHVVANAIDAVEEVVADEGGNIPNKDILLDHLGRLTQFSEWGQCAVLRYLSKYEVTDEAEMFAIMNILDGLLKQSSSAVVLAVTKIFVDLTSNRPDLQFQVLDRLKGPLLTLMANPTPELAYTVLVHIHALVQKGEKTAEIFTAEYKQFYCRYNDPSYVKSIKIDILTVLANPGNAEEVVGEMSEYVTDVDAEISRRAIRAIGKLAVRVPTLAEMIVGSLTGLLQLDIDYVSTEAAVVMKDLVRKYPEQFQRASGAVERCIRIVTEPDGKCAILWILGEYGLLIDDAPYLLEPMIDGFLEEPSGAVRLETLTAAVKLFFLRPPEMQKMLGGLLDKAINVVTHPDVRDRALLYYRLLEHSPEEARRVICAAKEIVDEFQEEMDQELREKIFDEFNTLSIIYQQPAAKYVVAKACSVIMSKMMPPPLTGEAAMDGLNVASETVAEVPSYNAPGVFENPEPQVTAPPSDMADLLGGGDDLLGGDDVNNGTALTTGAAATSFVDGDLLGGDDFGTVQPSAVSAGGGSPQQAGDLLGMDDLLGGGVTSAPTAAQPFTLAAGVRMDPGHFERQWYALQGMSVLSRPLKAPSPLCPLNPEALSNSLERGGIGVVVQGEADGAIKVFAFGRQGTGPPPPMPGDTWFLVELVVTPGAMAVATIKAENGSPQSAEKFSATMWECLDAWVVR